MTEWADQVQAAFVGLEGPHVDKQRATIIALVDARLAGRSEESVWSLPQTCSRKTYHEKWKRQPAFKAALDEVTRLAREWSASRTVRALQKAAETMALAAPVAADKLVALLEAEEKGIQLRAAKELLDRAGIETASKAPGTTLNVTELSDDELLAIARSGGGSGEGTAPPA